MASAMNKSTFGKRWQLSFATSCQKDDIIDKIDEHDPHILHISAHGNRDGFSFQDQRANAILVDKERLGAILGFHKHLELVVLSSCYSDSRAHTMANVVGNVIAMEDEITNADAASFAKEFYGALGQGFDLADAVRRAKQRVQLRSAGLSARLFECSPARKQEIARDRRQLIAQASAESDEDDEEVDEEVDDDSDVETVWRSCA